MQFCAPLLAGGPLLGGALPGGHLHRGGIMLSPAVATARKWAGKLHLHLPGPLSRAGGQGGQLGEKDPRPTLLLPPSPGVRVLLVDQWVETGGTMQGAIQLVERQGGVVAGKDGRGHPGWTSSPCLA